MPFQSDVFATVAVADAKNDPKKARPRIQMLYPFGVP